MKCKNCGKENLIRAQYCQDCGQPFTDQERQTAYDQTFWGKLDKLKKAKEIVTLEAVTSHPIFRALFLALLVFVGVITGNNKGTVMRPLESENYTVAYNQEKDEYYLFTELDSVPVPLYLPGVPKGVRISAESENGDVDTKEYTVSENPVLARDSSVVYTIYGVYEDTEEMIRVLIYDPSVLN